MNRSLPWALTAESMFTDQRAPVLATTGVRPTAPRWYRSDSPSEHPPRQRNRLSRRPSLPRHGWRGTARTSSAAPPRDPAGGAMQRTLRREPHHPEQPAHAHLAERHTELTADQIPDHATGPQLEPKRQLARITTHDQRVQPRDLLPAKLRRATRNRLGLQRVLATLAHLGQPAVDGVLVKPHHHRHVLRMRPASTCSTARIRSASNVLWSSLRPSLSRTPEFSPLSRQNPEITRQVSTYL